MDGSSAGPREAGLVELASADRLLHGVVDFEDNTHCAVVAVALPFVFVADDGENIQYVRYGFVRNRKAGFETRQFLRRFTLRRAPVAVAAPTLTAGAD